MFSLIFSLIWLTVLGVAATAAWVEHWLAEPPSIAKGLPARADQRGYPN
jgi:hypothetical protein